jgi:hypothetical protein
MKAMDPPFGSILSSTYPRRFASGLFLERGRLLLGATQLNERMFRPKLILIDQKIEHRGQRARRKHSSRVAICKGPAPRFD